MNNNVDTSTIYNLPDGPNLEGINLQGQDLSNGNFNRAHLKGANLSWATLRGASFRYADLTAVDLSWTDLTGANLSEACLWNTNFHNAILTKTILAPGAPIPPCTDEQLRTALLTPKRVKGRDRVYGQRTEFSIFIGRTFYKPRRFYTAPVFSIDPSSPSHPGISLGGTEIKNASFFRLIDAWAYRDEVLFISPEKGVRCKRIWTV